MLLGKDFKAPKYLRAVTLKNLSDKDLKATVNYQKGGLQEIALPKQSEIKIERSYTKGATELIDPIKHLLVSNATEGENHEVLKLNDEDAHGIDLRTYEIAADLTVKRA